MTAIEFPEMTPVKVMVNGLVPPLDKLALMFPFVPVTDPVAVAEKESGEQLSDGGLPAHYLLEREIHQAF